MHFSGQKFSWIYIGVACLVLCHCAQSQDNSNLLQAVDQVQAPTEQPSFPIETFTGPGSSVESEAAKPFNTVATDPTKVVTDAATGAATTVQEAVNPTKIETQIPNPNVKPTPTPTPTVTPVNEQESGGKLPNPLPTNTNTDLPAELGPLIQLLKAILSNPQFAMSGGLPLGPPPSAFGQLQGSPLGDNFGSFGPSPFMGGPRPSRFPGGGRRIARIIIMRRPRGMGGMGGMGGMPMPMDGNFIGNN